MNIYVTVEVETDDAHATPDNELLERVRLAAEDAVAGELLTALGDSWSCEAKVRVDL